MAPIVHTPLESFLLLRALHPYEGEPYRPSFELAADSLRSDTILQESGNLDGARLQPESLKDLYLRLVKEQAKLEASSRTPSPSNDSNLRKRKISTPPIETLDEASEYAYLLPNLVDRLYHQYKDDTIKSIDDEEREFRTLQKQIHALELHTNEARAARPGSQGVPPISALLRETEDSAQPPRSADPTTNGVPDGIPIPSGNLHADIYKPLSQPGSAENGAPYLPPPPAPPPQNYPMPASAADRRSSITNQHSSASPHLTHAPLPQADRSSASPIILPPPKGMVRSSRSPSMPSPQQSQYPPTRQPSSQHPSARHQSYYYDSQGYPVPYPSYSQNAVPIYHPHGGNMQPYHMPTPHSTHPSPYGTQAYQTPVSPPRSGYYGSHNQYPTTHTPYTQPASQYHDTKTPSQAPTSQQAPKLSPLNTSSRLTRWKKLDAREGANPPGSPVRPNTRSLSPISDPGSDLDGPTPKTARTIGSNRDHRSESREHSVSERPSSRGRGGRRRGTGTRGRRGRAGSIASSTVAGSRRSQSVAEDATVPKAEQSFAADDTTWVASPNADDPSRKSTRRRRETIRDAEVDPPRLKRKRDDELAISTPGRRHTIQDSPLATPSTPRRAIKRPGYVLATRNFARITQPLMTDITSHRLASLFAKPLTERDAPGYKDLILRPQDLKSIRGAISTGGRALTAALDDLGDSAGAGAHIWVPETEDLVPPKGIVNAGQLEKELMRIFANAVMFNPDVPENRGLGPAFRTRRRLREGSSVGESSSQEETGKGTFEIGVAAPQEGDMVQDTRQVAKDVQESFVRWRAVDREREDDIAVAGEAEGGEEEDASEGEVKESVEVEEEGERRSKRRKK